jgi:hypothetical protein
MEESILMRQNRVLKMTCLPPILQKACRFIKPGIIVQMGQLFMAGKKLEIN